MALESFIVTLAAVLVGNLLSGVVVYGLWRATKIERKFGVEDGSRFLPFPLLLAMLIPPGIVAWGASLLY